MRIPPSTTGSRNGSGATIRTGGVRDRRWLRGASLTCLWCGLAWCVQPLAWPTETQSLQRELARLLLLRKPQIAAELPARLLEREPDDPWCVAAAAEAAASRSEDATAIDFFQRLPRDGGRWEFIAERGLARRAQVRGRLADAERHLRRALEIHPNDLDVLDGLGHLLQVEGRTWEAVPYFLAQVLRGRPSGDQLLGTAASDRFFRSDDDLQRAALAQEPPEPLMLLASARNLALAAQSTAAEQQLRIVTAALPESGEAQGRLGRLLVDRGDLPAFLNWRGGLSDAARRHPEVWFAQGLQARRSDQVEGAARCFLEVLELSPQHLGAHIHAAACLQQLGHTQAATAFSERGELLSELDSVLNVARADSRPEFIVKIVGVMERLGRHWEAAGWASRLAFLPYDADSTDALYARCIAVARGDWRQQDPDDLPARLVNREDFPLPHWELPPKTAPQPESDLANSIAWQFSNDAQPLGIQFEYFEGTQASNRLEHIFNVMGGGVGVIDFDIDGWPDLYLAQANQWRVPQPQPEYPDRLYRNRGGRQFVDVGVEARVGDLSFSHGVTVGDFDQDGLPDVYLGNLGPNCLYHNNGDGTFEEQAVAAGVAGDEWSTSAVFADVTGDALPDLYVVNYTERDETARTECGTPDRRRACTPDVLPAAEHRCYVNTGDGRFRDVTAACGMLGTPGKGLGVVAWDFLGDGRLGLFIANDTTPDFLFVNAGPDAAGVPQFRNEGVVRGIAYDANGNPQASMGVAAGDVSGDGRIDLAITDFYASGNSLFVQDADGYFHDQSQPSGVYSASLKMLGFGCQFADMDGDGWQDLIVANGHVDQANTTGSTADSMPPQLFLNARGEGFVEAAAADLGAYFQRGYLGRGLATLDWNRDGLTDFGVTKLHSPFALVTNQTPPLSRPLVVRLLGATGCREPTGARLRLLDGDHPQYRLQTAGDGFLVTNERRHQFAVPDGPSEASVEVEWPGGLRQRFEHLTIGKEHLLVEGRTQALTLPIAE